MAIVRLVALTAAALGFELSRGAGAATLVLSILIGALRWNPLSLVAAAVGGAAVSLALPETESGGKVLHGLSNAPFLALLYVLLALAGYAVGRLARALRKR